eukprot:gb/GEZN01015076.1/.p1 GENE.gb/GEZN01015076.1/~~gb/GEZN01015076.1/.p1  ORF type:complete len:139 (-),score=16.17 gb/GEZN01015076.1/:465-881(-)
MSAQASSKVTEKVPTKLLLWGGAATVGLVLVAGSVYYLRTKKTKGDSGFVSSTPLTGELVVRDFKVVGMTCGACVKTLTNAVSSQVQTCKIDLATKSVKISYDTNVTTTPKLMKLIEEVGFEVVAYSDNSGFTVSFED